MIRNDPFIGSRNVYDIVVSGGVKASFGSRRDQWNRGVTHGSSMDLAMAYLT